MNSCNITFSFHSTTNEGRPKPDVSVGQTFKDCEQTRIKA